MSLAGLGLSLGELAQAKSAPGAGRGRAAPSDLAGLHADGDSSAAASAGLDLSPIPAGPLDVTLSSQDAAATPSEEDRAAVALAMVLMADPPASETSRATPDFAASAPRWEFSAEFLRDFRDASSPGESFDPSEVSAPVAAPAEAPIESASRAERRIDREAGAPTPHGRLQDRQAPIRIAHVDLDLSAASSVIPAPDAGPDVNLDLSSALDLNLDLSPGLDLNLDLAPEVDLRLDRPPVFAVTRLKPLGSANESPGAARLGSSARACTVDEPLLVLDAARPMMAPMAPMAPLAQVAVPAQTAVAASAAPNVQPELEAAPAPTVEAAPKVAPTIVVASHADRVLRSLEILLTNDDPAATRLGPQREEVFVTSHAEKALLTLASTCAGERAAPVADETPRISKVALPPPAAACRPSANAAPAARQARRSAIGADAVALSQRDLDQVRGGFETSAGLKISFGIERAVYINGALVTTTSLNLSDLGKVTGGAGVASAAVAGSSNLTLIQNGPGNTFVSGPVSAATVGTIVQNTLNDQKIQSVTAINATVNSLQLVRAQNFQSTLRGVLVDSLRR